MKYLFSILLIITLVSVVLFSGCVSDNNTNFNSSNPIFNDNNDANYLSQYNNNGQQTDLQNKVEDIAESEDYKNAIDENKNNESKEQIEYCIIDMGEVTQEFWFSEEYARMYTQGKDNFTDKVIDKDKQCTTNEKGTHICLPLDDSFESIVEGWKTMGQMAGKCNAMSYDMKIFKTLTEQQ